MGVFHFSKKHLRNLFFEEVRNPVCPFITIVHTPPRITELNQEVTKLTDENKQLEKTNDYLRDFMSGMSKSMQKEIDDQREKIEKLKKIIALNGPDPREGWGV